MAAVHERYCDWVALRRQQLWCHFIAFTRATRVLASHAGDFGANLHSSIHLNGSITDVLPRGNGRCSQEINQPSSTFSSRSEESNHWKWNMKTNHFKFASDAESLSTAVESVDVDEWALWCRFGGCLVHAGLIAALSRLHTQASTYPRRKVTRSGSR